MDYSNQKDKSFFFNGRGKVYQVFVDTIVYIECHDSTSSRHLAEQDKSIHCCDLLKDIEERLDGLNFYRINRNTLLNLRYFSKFVSEKKELFKSLRAKN